MAHTILLFVVLLAFGPEHSSHAQHVHPAPAQSATAPSSLTAEEVQQLLEGDGMGMARAAELHGYPGPKHILERAEDLALTPAQREQITAIRGRMLAEAQRLGREIVEQEHALDEAFRSKAVSRGDLVARARAIGALRADLRAAHLAAHLESVTVLTPEQVRTYYEHGVHGK
jgi:Spy/CpxP family protein refolding chaperone